jgi:type IV secretion system protein VirD4
VARHLSAAAVRRTDGPGRRLHLGRDLGTGTELYGSLSSAYCVVGPGDALPLLVPAVADAPGAVLVITTRPDLVRQTARDRREHGDVWVYDPLELSGGPDLLAWGPEQGCADPPTALRRARAMTAGAGLLAPGAGRPATVPAEADGGPPGPGGPGQAEPGPGRTGPPPALGWADTVAAVVRCYLHAAAVDGRDAGQLRAWVADPAHAEPIRILTSSSLAADGWAAELAELARLDGAERTAVWSGVRRVFGWLADPRAVRQSTPGRTSRFDPSYFVAHRGTLYVYGSASAEPSVSPLVTALCEDVVESGRRVAARSPAGRLDPPLLVLLDDAPAAVTLPDLPVRLAEDGGRGVTWVTRIGSRGQADARWGEAYGRALARSGAVQIVLGGLANALDPAAVSTAPAQPGRPSSDLRHLAADQAVVVHTAAGPVAVRLPARQHRPEAEPATS